MIESLPSTPKLNEALIAAQAEMPVVPFDSTNPFLKNRYASLGSVISVSKPVLTKHGLAIEQQPISINGQIGVRTILRHISGESSCGDFTIPVEAEKGKSAAQVAGSVITYLRRYAWSSVCGLYADEDNDGHDPEPRSHSPASRPVQTPSTTQKPPESKPSSTAKPSGAVQDKRPEWKAWMIRQLLPVKEAAMAYAIDKAIIMPNEGLEDWPLDQVVMSKETMAQLLAAIQGNPTDRNDPDHRNPPEPEMAVNDTRPKMEGVIRNVTLKEGKNARGPWSLWGIKLDTGNGDVWLNSFSNTVGQAASALKGQIAVIAYSEDEKGKTALEVRRPGETEEDV